MLKKAASVFCWMFFFVTALSSETLCYQVACETTGTMVVFAMSFQFRCKIPSNAVIDTPYFIISSAGLVASTLTLSSNRNIAYLPREVFKNFPDLSTYLAASCSIKTISNENFENLKNLTTLNLSDNKITKIDSGTFGGIRNLVTVDLSA